MQTNIGQLVANLFDKYEHLFVDKRIAAVAATEVVNELLVDRDRRGNQVRHTSNSITRVQLAI